MTDSQAPSSSQPAARRKAFTVLVIAVVLVGLGWAFYALKYLRHYESTDDAYVAADVVQVTSEVAGTVTAVHVGDTQTVSAGDPLVELDPADAQLAVASAEAGLAKAVRDVGGLYALEAGMRAELQSREVALLRGLHDYQRRQPLLADGAVSAEELGHAKDAIDELRSAVEVARSRMSGLAAQIQGGTIATHPQVLSAASTLRSAALALRRTRVTAPVAGVVAKRGVQLGERVAPGVPLLAIVPLTDVWIDANFKEVQLGRLRVGQPVRIRADEYGTDVEYHGRVAGLAAGSGSAFALLPAQNASGNWIKIVQRVPVRVALDPKEVVAHPLRVGMSTSVRVDVADASGVDFTRDVRGGAPMAARMSEEDPALTARIAEIIRGNSRTVAPVGTRRHP